MNFAAFRLTADEREELLSAQTECMISYTNADGWPVAVVQTYLWQRGSFWVTSFSDKPRVARWRADERTAVTVSSAGTDVGPERMVSARAVATVHDDAEITGWFFPAFATTMTPEPAMAPKLAAMLAAQDRVIVELRPVSWNSFDGMLLRRGGRRDSSR